MNNKPEVKKAPYEEALHFISFCNSLSEGSSEGRIADTVFKHTDHISALTVEQLAEEASVSLSSVSRFFSKAGFESFSSFKNIFSDYLNDISRIRVRSIYREFPGEDITTPADTLLNRAVDNLSATRTELDMSSLNKAVNFLIERKNCVFIGDTRDLNAFTITQLDLLAMGKSCYMKNIQNTDVSTLKMLGSNVTACFISVYKGWYTDIIQQLAKQVGKMDWHTILLCQDGEVRSESMECCIKYGIPDSKNNGYYSLQYLSELMNIVLYKKSNH